MCNADLACDLLVNFPAERSDRRFLWLDAPTGSAPVPQPVAVTHKKNAPCVVKNRSEDTDCGHACDIVLTRTRSATAGESEHGLEWTGVHKESEAVRRPAVGCIVWLGPSAMMWLPTR